MSVQKFVAIHQVNVELFLSIIENVDLLVVQKEKSE